MIEVVIKQVAIFLVYIIIGIILKKAELLPENSEAVISKLETNLILPVYIFSSLVTKITVENIKEYSITIIYGFLFIGIAFLVGCFFSIFFSQKGQLRNIYKYLFTVTNFGYFGYPFIEGVFGAEMKANMMMFCIPLSLFTYTVGVYLLQGKSETKRKMGPSPILIGLFLGVVFGLLSFNIPQGIQKILSDLSSCMSPLAMILLGLTIASAPILKLFVNYKAYILSIIRLLIIPVVIGIVFWAVGARNTNLILPVLISGMPIGMNVVVFLQGNDENTYLGSQYCFISVILSILTIPLLYYLMTILGVC